MTLLLSLYPRESRERYEDEFLALLEARPPDAHDRVDIIRGAIDARLHPRADVGGSLAPPAPIPYDGPWRARSAGWVTFAGGLLYVVTFLLAINGPLVEDGGKVYRDGSSGIPTLFLAVALLTIGIWTVVAMLPGTSRFARAAAYLGASCGLLWALGPWMMMLGAVLWVGVAILAIESARTGRWRVSDAAIIVIGIVAAMGVVVIALTGMPVSAGILPVATPDIQYVMLLAASTLWFGMAHALLRPAAPVADPVRHSAPVA